MNREEPPLVVETPGGLSVKYRGRLLYSERDPGRLPRRAAAACDPGPARLHIVFSPLLWYGLPELLKRMGPGSVALCVEADPSLAQLALRAAPPGLLDDPRVVFVDYSSPEELVQRARELGRFRACTTLALSGGESINAPLYRRMAGFVAADIESRWRSRAALVVLGRLWAKNLFDNLAALPELDTVALPRFSGAAVVCGAGPSLEAALPLIARRRDRLSVVACDTALGSLLAAGIEPDLVVCLEGQAHNLADFTPLAGQKIALVADLSSHPATFRAVRGSKHLSMVRLAESSFLDRVAALLEVLGAPILAMPPLGSVGVHAVHLTRGAAQGPVLATGLDFSFEAGKTHARGSPSLLAEERRLCRLGRWPGQYAVSFRQRTGKAPCPPLTDGRPLLSDPLLLSYAGLLAESAATPGPALYDIRGRGPSIGALPLSLGDAENLLESMPPSRTIPVRRFITAEALRSGLGSFFSDEIARLESLRKAMKGDAPFERESFIGLVAESDYLCWSFPDPERARDLPQDFLNRLVPEVEYWSRRIGNLSASTT